MSETFLHGGCLCGAVRFTIAGPLGLGEYCHCSRCRKAHGTAFSANAVVDTDALRIVQGEDALVAYAPTPMRRRRFCGRCGSPLFIERLDRPAIRVVAIGALDDAAFRAPERHVFTDSKAPWHALDDTLPRYRVYPGCEPEDAP